MCLYPRLLKNKKYVPNKKNDGNPPPLPKRLVNGKWVDDVRVSLVPVGCGKCIECMRQKKNNWRIRLAEEVRENCNGHFVTFTFSNEALSDLYERYFIETGLEGYLLDNELATKAIRLFLERWRKKTKKSVRHWFITELGHKGTENIHLHGIIWTDKSADFVEETWSYGFVWNSKKYNGYVNERTVNYITKYCTKMDSVHKYYVPKILCSKGIGRGYFDRDDWKLNKFNGVFTESSYRTSQGYKISLPIYYRNKIYSDSEREKLWCNMLDKNERYVDGIKINMNSLEGEKDYWRHLLAARKKNVRLGYGNDEKDWKKYWYEHNKRKLMHEKRGI